MLDCGRYLDKNDLVLCILKLTYYYSRFDTCNSRITKTNVEVEKTEFEPNFLT